MLNYMLKKVFGTKDDREVKRILKTVNQINALQDSYRNLTDEELKSKTVEFKNRIQAGEEIDELLVEAFATVREASARVLGMRHFDVQLIGGIVLHEGKIAEMKTGEGKTLVATCPVYLNALSGKGVHVVTVNDYLAQRDKEWMGKIYNFLGLSVGVVLNGSSSSDRIAAYGSDITYGTNNEFGFDYLRDNMNTDRGRLVQRGFNYAIVDEVDSILIDEARTPLIISGSFTDTVKYYKQFATIAKQLAKGRDYEVDEKHKTIFVTEAGIDKVEKFLNLDNLYSAENIELTHYLNQSIKAIELFAKDRDYIVKDGEVLIVDEFTGRIMDGRRYSEGLHQALEAKENVNIAAENQTLATITLQNYFRMYKKLSGMTGTAKTEEGEFVHIYKLSVVAIPTNRDMMRKDHSDLIYRSEKEKFEAVIDKILEVNAKGQPVLIGTTSIRNSEILSALLKVKGIAHNVLNAKFHHKEAEIVAQAGRFAAVTIATNMAGRGTDILLGGNPEFLAKLELDETDENYANTVIKYKFQCEEEKKKVLAAGGLYIIGTERHESRRIDNQLRGRSGRQGDPGESTFYLSLEDDLMRLFGSDRVAKLMDKTGFEYKEAIEHPIITKALENSQKRVEARNFSIRKQLLEYDDVMNKQREVIYRQRQTILSKELLTDEVYKVLSSVIDNYIRFYLKKDGEWELDGLREKLYEVFGYRVEATDLETWGSALVIKQNLIENLYHLYEDRMANIPIEIKTGMERYIMLDVIDSRWKENLQTLDAVRESVHLRAYGQKDPVVEYKIISSEIYDSMSRTIGEEIVSFLFKVRNEENIIPQVINLEKSNSPELIYTSSSEDAEPVSKTVVNKNKVGRNEPCTCGSGKKYKNCCGNN